MRQFAFTFLLASIGAHAQGIYQLSVECEDCTYTVQTRKFDTDRFVQIVEETKVRNVTHTRELYLPSNAMVSVIVSSRRTASQSGDVRGTKVGLMNMDKDQPTAATALGFNDVTLMMLIP